MNADGAVPAIWAIAIFGAVWTLLTSIGAWILIDIKRALKENEARASKTRHDVRDTMHGMQLESTALATRFGFVEKQVEHLNTNLNSQQSQSLAIAAAAAVVGALNQNHQLIAAHKSDPPTGSSFR